MMAAGYAPDTQGQRWGLRRNGGGDYAEPAQASDRLRRLRRSEYERMVEAGIIEPA